MKRKNEGFSLVELIVVIAILAILTGSTVSILQYRNYSDINRCTGQLNAVLDRVRTETISKTDKTYLYLYKKDNSYYMLITKKNTLDNSDKGNGTRIANSNIKIEYLTHNGATPITLDDSTPIAITFKKSTGAFYRADGNFYSQIRFINKNASKTIHMVEGTGRHYVR